MTRATQTRRLAFHLAFVGAATIVLCQVSPGQSASQTEGECRPATARQKPSYESFFGRQASVEAESPEWRIVLARTDHSPSCPNQFTFSVSKRRESAVSQFKICNESAQVDEVGIIGKNKALILGRATASISVATAVELPSGKVADHFMCFLPALSPNHRFLAFIKMFPPHPGPVAISDEYLVYDLTRDGEYNRPHFKVGVGYDPGWPLYPPGATNAIGENVVPEGSPFHSRSSQALFWLDDDTLAFADFFQGRNNLVVANLSRGVRYADVRTLSLDPSQLIDLDQCRKTTAPSDFESWSKEPAGLIRVSEIELVPDRPGMACLVFVPSPCLRYATFIAKLP